MSVSVFRDTCSGSCAAEPDFAYISYDECLSNTVKFPTRVDPLALCAQQQCHVESGSICASTARFLLDALRLLVRK